MLEVREVHVRYGNVRALNSVSLMVERGVVTSLIGANGAGKTTCLRAISGLAHAHAGSIWLDGEKINGMSPAAIARLGIAHVPEGKGLFPQLSVLKNLKAGAYLRSDRHAIAEDLELVFKRFPVLGKYRARAAKTLSGGEQQMLALARAMMSRPRLYLFDEPSLGLAPRIVSEVVSHIRSLAEQGAAVMLVEQNARLALRLAKTAYVLETGRIAMHGDAKDLANNEHVKDAYLGVA